MLTNRASPNVLLGGHLNSFAVLRQSFGNVSLWNRYNKFFSNLVIYVRRLVIINVYNILYFM